MKNSVPGASSPSREFCYGEKEKSDMETKLEKTELSEKASFRLNLEKQPISVRTRRVRGY